MPDPAPVPDATSVQGPSTPAQRLAAPRWHRDHRLALGGIVVATLITMVVGFLGPSAVTLTLGPRNNLMPPWYLPTDLARAGDWAVSAALWGAVIIGGSGLLIGMRALAAGWRPNVRRLFGLGVVLNLATICVPPLTSADVLMYAGYGRLQLIGRNPYDITPAEIYRSSFDPVMQWTEQPWTDTPSVYGPIVSWSQLLANYLGGDNMHNVVFWLQVMAVLPLIAVGAGMVWLAHGDLGRQARAVLFGVCNPLLIWAVTAGAHNEAMSVMFAVFALLLMRKTSLGAGFAIGLAGCCKLSIGIYGLAMLWAYRREPKKALLLCLGTIVPMGLAYVWWEPTAFFSVLRNGSYVSIGQWANPVYRFADLLVGDGYAKVITGVLSWSLLVVIAAMLSRVVPWSPAPGLQPGEDPRRDPITIALRTTLVLATAWLTASMYTLSWYDLIAFVPLAVCLPTRLDWLFVVRGVFLSLTYIPGRSIAVVPSLHTVSQQIGYTVSPFVQFCVLVAIVHWWWTSRRQQAKAGDDPDAVSAAGRGAQKQPVEPTFRELAQQVMARVRRAVDAGRGTAAAGDG